MRMLEQLLDSEELINCANFASLHKQLAIRLQCSTWSEHLQELLQIHVKVQYEVVTRSLLSCYKYTLSRPSALLI